METRLFASLLLLVSAPAFAQTAGGVAGISGVVHDPSGSAVPNAKVVISSDAQGTVRTATTNSSGGFTAPALVPGRGYKVAVTAAGFAGYEARDIVLQVGQQLDLNVQLTVAASTTQVDVTASTPLVE